MSEDQEELPYSRLRNFLIPDTKNTLESASFRHFQGDFDRSRQLLNLAKDKIDQCLTQLEQDQQESQNGEEEEW